MNPHRVTLVDGAAMLAVLAGLSWPDLFSIVASVVAIIALAPLAYIRWKRLVNGKAPDSGKPEPK